MHMCAATLQRRALSIDLLTKLSAVVVEEEKDEAIEAQKEKAKEQIDDHALNSSLPPNSSSV